MKLYDISQEVFSCCVYPGDPRPEKQTIYATAQGDICNLTAFAMCAHNGTHVDAPFHFLHGGKTVDRMDLEVFVGECFVARRTGDLGAAEAEEILACAAGAERILIAGEAVVTAEAAEVFAAAGIRLLGIPALFCAVLFLVGIRGTYLLLPLLIFSMPLGLNLVVFPESLGEDASENAKLCFVSYILAAFILPVTFAALTWLSGLA